MVLSIFLAACSLGMGSPVTDDAPSCAPGIAPQQTEQRRGPDSLSQDELASLCDFTVAIDPPQPSGAWLQKPDSSLRIILQYNQGIPNSISHSRFSARLSCQDAQERIVFLDSGPLQVISKSFSTSDFRVDGIVNVSVFITLNGREVQLRRQSLFAADTIPPKAPSNLSVRVLGENATLTWQASDKDIVGCQVQAWNNIEEDWHDVRDVKFSNENISWRLLELGKGRIRLKDDGGNFSEWASFELHDSPLSISVNRVGCTDAHVLHITATQDCVDSITNFRVLRNGRPIFPNLFHTGSHPQGISVDANGASFDFKNITSVSLGEDDSGFYFIQVPSGQMVMEFTSSNQIHQVAFPQGAPSLEAAPNFVLLQERLCSHNAPREVLDWIKANMTCRSTPSKISCTCNLIREDVSIQYNCGAETRGAAGVKVEWTDNQGNRQILYTDKEGVVQAPLTSISRYPLKMSVPLLGLVEQIFPSPLPSHDGRCICGCEDGSRECEIAHEIHEALFNQAISSWKPADSARIYIDLIQFCAGTRLSPETCERLRDAVPNDVKYQIWSLPNGRCKELKDCLGG